MLTPILPTILDTRHSTRLTSGTDEPYAGIRNWPGPGSVLDSLDLDLHGKTWPEALKEFVDSYNRAVQPGGHACRTLRVIHGYGSEGGPGILRTRFRKFLE